MKLCPVCQNSYPGEQCPLDSSPLIAQELALLEQGLLKSALYDDIRGRREHYLKLAHYFKNDGQAAQAISYFYKADIYEPRTPLSNNLKEIVGIYLQQEKIPEALVVLQYIVQSVPSSSLKLLREYLEQLQEVKRDNTEWQMAIKALSPSGGYSAPLNPEHTLELERDMEVSFLEHEFNEEILDITDFIEAEPPSMQRIPAAQPITQASPPERVSGQPLPFIQTSRPQTIARKASQTDFTDQIALIVDEDDRVREVLADILIDLGCHVVEAIDGQEAIDKLKDFRPSFITSDVIMPRRDGYSLFDYCQKSAQLRDVPFIFLTAHGHLAAQFPAQENGIEDYWLKPFDIEEMSLRLQRLLQKIKLGGNVQGSLAEMPLADLLPSLTGKDKSGILILARAGKSGLLYIDQGAIIDAEFEDHIGKTALYALINWCQDKGTFNFRSQNIVRPLVIKQNLSGILMETMRRREEELQLLQQLPPVDVFMAVNREEIPDLLSANFSDGTMRIIQLFDGTHSLKECLDCLRGDLETIQTVIDLNKAGILRIAHFGIEP